MITEQEILESLKILIKKSSEFSNVLLGSGDDAAIIKTKEELVHSLDISVEGVHFLEELIPAEYISYRSIAIALSDIAAMGAYPSFFSIGLTSNNEDINWYTSFNRGVERIIDEYQIPLVGGDITKERTNISVSVFGHLFNKNLKRSTAQVNDDIYITGQLGLAKKGLIEIKENGICNSPFIDAYLTPKAQFKKSKEISPIANACIDISDGLLNDLGHICKQSGVGANIYIDDIPITTDIMDLTYGDDYELCFTISKDKSFKYAEGEYFKIGTIIDSNEINIFDKGKPIEMKTRGWDPFKK